MRKLTGRLINLALWEGLSLLYKEGESDEDEQKKIQHPGPGFGLAV